MLNFQFFSRACEQLSTFSTKTWKRVVEFACISKFRFWQNWKRPNRPLIIKFSTSYFGILILLLNYIFNIFFIFSWKLVWLWFTFLFFIFQVSVFHCFSLFNWQLTYHNCSLILEPIYTMIVRSRDIVIVPYYHACVIVGESRQTIDYHDSTIMM